MLSIYSSLKWFLIPDIVSQEQFSQEGKNIILFEENERFRVVARAFQCLQVDVLGVSFVKPES